MRMEKILPVPILLYLLFSLISITAGQTFLGLAFLAWIFLLWQKREPPRFPAFFWPLLIYAGLTLVASLFSDNRAVSFRDSRELLILLVVPIVYVGITQFKELRFSGLAFLISALVSIAYSLLYFFLKAAPGERIAGFMDHYMTQAGLLLLFSALALSQFLFGDGKVRWVWGAGFALSGVALVLTLTRNAWVGIVIVTGLLLFLYKPKALVLLPVIAALFFVASPGHVKRRALSIFDPQSYSNAQRIEYLHAGLKIIRDYPIFGTGPNTVHIIFQRPQYNLSEEARSNVHLHNNLIQIAAERGILTLLTWLGFMGWACCALIKLIRENQDRLLTIFAAAGLAGLAGLFAAGFFEYNWGDSEVVTLFLCLITLPFGYAHRLKKTGFESHT